MERILQTVVYPRIGCLSPAVHLWLAWLATLVGVQSVTWAQPDQSFQKLRARGTLIWGADQEGGGPYVYPDANDPDRAVGFEVDIANELAGRLGVKAQFAQGQWDKLPELLNRGDIDIVLNGYEWNQSRASRFGCSLPYYIYELQLLGKRGSPVASWEAFLGNAAKGGTKPRIGVLGGSAAHEYLEQHFVEQVEIVQFEGASEAMRAVELGIDGVQANLQDLPVWLFYQAGFPELNPVGAPVGRGYYVILTRQQDTQLLQAVNKATLEMLNDGSMRSILTKYGLWNPTQSARGLEVDRNGSFVVDLTSPTSSSSDASTSSYQSVRGWAVISQRGFLLVKAALITILLSITSMPIAIAVGMSLALGRMFGPRWLDWLIQAYIEIIRGTPLVLQLYVIFFLLPELGLSIDAFWAGVIGLAMNYSAYEAEIYRAGIQAIPKGQWEAATALGMSRAIALRRVILPQATRIVIPPVTNDFIALFKDTAVCSVITVVELSKEYSIHARSSGAIVELGVLTAILYLVMSYPLSKVASYLERHLNKDRR